MIKLLFNATVTSERVAYVLQFVAYCFDLQIQVKVMIHTLGKEASGVCAGGDSLSTTLSGKKKGCQKKHYTY